MAPSIFSSLQFHYFMDNFETFKEAQVQENDPAQKERLLIEEYHSYIAGQELIRIEDQSTSVKNKKESKQGQKFTKNVKIQYQMKKIGFALNNKNMDKYLLAKNLINIIGSFFNPMISTISQKQRNMCEKLGWAVQKQANEKEKFQNQQMVDQQAKILNGLLINHNTGLLDNEKMKCQDSKSNRKPKQLSKKLGQSMRNKGHKKRIIRKVLRKALQLVPSKRNGDHQKVLVRKAQQLVPLKRNDDDQKVLVKNMQESFDCKLKNNRLYMKGMPKKPVSSFFFFFKYYSKKIHEEHQRLQISKQLTYGSALAKRISKRWKQMTLQDKLPYKKLSLTTREQYRSKMEQFKSQNSEVFESFKKIKRMKANQTRRIKLQKNNSYEMSDLEQKQDDSQSGQEQINVGPKKENILNIKQIALIDQQNEDLSIVIPKQDLSQYVQNKRNKASENRQRFSRQRFKSIHKPKSPSPSFFFFYNLKKLEIAKQHGVKTGAKITKIASVMWKKMQEEDKHPYEVMADERRKKYYEEMKRFQVDYPQEWASMIAYRRRKPVVLCKHKQNSGSQANSESQNEHNSQSIGQKVQSLEIDSLEGTVIKKTHNPANNIPLESKTQKAGTLQEKTNDIEDLLPTHNQTRTQQSKKSGRSRNLPKNKQYEEDYKIYRPKAPVSSFFMFYKENNAILADQFKEAHGGKLVQYASEIWKNMIDAEKKPYQIQAQESRQKYYKQMDQYKQKFPDGIKKRRMDLKKKHQEEAEGQRKPSRRKKPIPNSSIEKIFLENQQNQNQNKIQQVSSHKLENQAKNQTVL